ncbi:MAG: hypothetical protein AB8W78_08515 [Arsenophonus endosymbiont of Dermacentor nuttalli]
MVNGTSTFTKAYATIVSDIASKASQAKVELTAQSVITKSYFEKQQSISGVNLDEEYLGPVCSICQTLKLFRQQIACLRL